MPRPIKALEAMEKHLTEAERQARLKAQQETMPDRGAATCLVAPKFMAGNAAAKRYWKQILQRMDGYAILDDLDSEALGVYCTMLAREEMLSKQLSRLSKEIAKLPDLSQQLEALIQIDGINSKLQSLERTMLQYAEKLGLTPTGRVRLAQKRAAQTGGAVSPDDDLYGDSEVNP